MCGFPGRPAVASHLEHEGTALVLGLCRRCVTAQQRLPLGVAHKRLIGAARRALTDSHRCYTARLPDLGAAQLTAGLLAHPRHASEAAQALGWMNAGPG